ncbi:MAG: cell division ATP-binding protein FtsE [Gammaproteobacteria bacterium]|nr:cell division ATP-binding protein FtsE [Gammaproteobacteria bacterium]
MIHFHHVSKRYPQGHDALKSVSFHIDDDEMVFLAGHSGAGKSTVLKLISLIERPSRGECMINNKNVMKIPRWRIPYFRRDIGIVFQDHKLLMDRTVFDNVSLPLVVAGHNHREISRRVNAALDKVDLLNKAKLLPVTLSGGEQQRVGIARAVVNKPAILLADEPTGNLDERLSDEIMDLFAEFNQHGVTVFIATHDLRQLKRMQKRVLQLHQGELVFDSLEQPL